MYLLLPTMLPLPQTGFFIVPSEQLTFACVSPSRMWCPCFLLIQILLIKLLRGMGLGQCFIPVLAPVCMGSSLPPGVKANRICPHRAIQRAGPCLSHRSVCLSCWKVNMRAMRTVIHEAFGHGLRLVLALGVIQGICGP